jgi:hypothetical protein
MAFLRRIIVVEFTVEFRRLNDVLLLLNDADRRLITGWR